MSAKKINNNMGKETFSEEGRQGEPHRLSQWEELLNVEREKKKRAEKIKAC